MPSPEQIQQTVENVRDQRTFIDMLLRDTLKWPIELDFEPDIEDITYEWSDEDLNAEGLSREVLSGPVLQMQSLHQEHKQLWGIFILEFANETPFTTGRGLAGPLRRVLNGLVRKRKGRPANLKAWGRPHLLFICTHKYRHFRFAYFKAPKEKGRVEPLATFGWEPGRPPRTVCEFNLGCLVWPENASDTEAWLKAWAAAFDKEPLTREFFKRFDEVLERMKADLEQYQQLPSAESYSRSQLLLERMIFLYFLQNRGWLNQQRRYLLDAFEAHRDSPDTFTFYEDSLEPLFWTLASAPNSASRLDGIPFLNGGLFDDDEFELSLKRKKNNPPLRIRNSSFQFMFSHLLEAFNFTVLEDTPLNQDVAVDPEMLGKVFESIVLHAEAEAEYNAPDKRKATGSYYTPRIVVHFICREALRLYLKNHLPESGWDERLEVLFGIDPTDGVGREELAHLKSGCRAQDGRTLLNVLRNIKTCDPAVGSGAFPVGLLHELVNLRRIAETVANGFVDPVRGEGNNWVHDTKADIVENCLYGVDIQQQAIEICRLRLWLSLIVDYDLGLDPFEADPVQFMEAIQKISQLPNLEMNFRRGDSLLDMICGVNVLIETNRKYQDSYDSIRKLSHELHRARKGERKRKLRVDILQQRLELSERVLSDEIRQLQTEDSNLSMKLFGETHSESQRRRQIVDEIQHLQEALVKVEADRRSLVRIANKPYDSGFYSNLRKLEGAEFDAPFNFAWRLDFADVFQAGTGRNEAGTEGGFDLILGNPPFVTARNPEKRELYRERWKRVCSGKYLLVCPFFDLSFGLLRSRGQLGFIVSNAFAKREFGRPLVEDFFPTVDLQKIVDCSGLLFPGHGTPTCILFGQNEAPCKESTVRITATLPGGGDLRTPPEDSPLWHTIAAHHDEAGYTDNRIAVSDQSLEQMKKHPWNFDSSGSDSAAILMAGAKPLTEFAGTIGPSTITRSNEVFVQPLHLLRRTHVEPALIRPFVPGDSLRNHGYRVDAWAICPYSKEYEVIELTDFPGFSAFIAPYREYLENVIVFGRAKKDTSRAWYEYTDPYPEKNRSDRFLLSAFIATHTHAVIKPCQAVFPQSAPVIILKDKMGNHGYPMLAGLLNASASVLWLKQNCYNKGAGKEEQLDRFEYAGTILEKLPVPPVIADALLGARSQAADSLTMLSEACGERGRQTSALTLRRLFEKPGEAYHDWNASLVEHFESVELDIPFCNPGDLRSSYEKLCSIREALRLEMIALQEEMDWLVYGAYEVIPLTSHAVPSHESAEHVAPIAREQRPFVLWQLSNSDFERACSLIPNNWTRDRRALWRARLECIRDNEHIRRIEQPVYKRRWDEQWKVGNSWQCGPTAYDAELVEAFDGWLSEKAEWWLQHEAKGEPVELDVWTEALWRDARIQAAWPVVREALNRLGRADTFERYFGKLVKSQAVPADIPWAIPWDELAKKMRIPAAVKRIRGKLNVPRERFRITSNKTYCWAGQNLFNSV